VPLLFFEQLRETLAILITFGMRHQEETWRKWLVLATSP